jgi:hypothetical protein
LFRVTGSEELDAALCLRGISTVFAGLFSGRPRTAAKLTVVALACSGSGSGLNFAMPINWDGSRAARFSWLSFPNHSSNPVRTLPTKKKYEKIGIRNLLLPSEDNAMGRMPFL